MTIYLSSIGEDSIGPQANYSIVLKVFLSHVFASQHIPPPKIFEGKLMILHE